MNKAELQGQIDKLQEQLDNIPDDKPEEKVYYGLCFKGYAKYVTHSAAPIFKVVEYDEEEYQQALLGHGLGVYKTLEMAEAACAFLIYILDFMKKCDNTKSSECDFDPDDNIYVQMGEKIIEQMRAGTYE